MPELPEVETVRRGLAEHVIGSKVSEIEVLDHRSLKRNQPDHRAFEVELKNQKLLSVVRRGKFIWMELDGGRALVCHLGMSGQVLIRSANYQPDPLTRVVLHLTKRTDSVEMRFVDQRLFGGMYLDDLVGTTDSAVAGHFPEGKPNNLIPQSASHIARDLLDPNFDREFVIFKMRSKNSGIKRVLLDQNLLSGIGNIYADESLWRARLHFDKTASSISARKLGELVGHAQEVLAEAVERGGTSFDEQYKNVNGESGYFSQDLNAYSRAGLPCARCETPIKREAWANRSSYFCPRCQRR
ncbi:MAG: bifunctional DNA-formamidopyrimidine glycosylase/DNA-(apurinic or apyrimidinic site) lyase [Aquiluna sp.]